MFWSIENRKTLSYLYNCINMPAVLRYDAFDQWHHNTWLPTTRLFVVRTTL